MRTFQTRFLGLFMVSVGLVLAPDAQANGNVHVSRFWHNHQPIYWPEWNSNGAQNNRVQLAWDSIVLKPGQTYGGISPAQHPENNLPEIFGNDDRKNSYQGGPRGSLTSFSGGGFALSYSGSLIDNVRQLAGENQMGYGGGWNQGNTEAKSWGRLDLVGFTYHHSLAPLLPKEVFRKELQIFKQAWWKAWGGKMDLSDHSKGFFPTEMAFSQSLIDVLVEEGYEWSIVASHHLSRTCPTYFNQFNLTNNQYGINSTPPNKADLLGPSPTTGWWYLEPNPGNASWNVAPFAYQLHKAQYVNPETGTTKQMYLVPSDDALSYRYGYSNEGIGQIQSKIAPFATDSSKPVLVMPSTDGDNAWGGGSSSWYEATPQFFNDSGNAGYVKNTPQGFVNAAKANADLVHIEDGAWIFPEMCYGSPNFLKWIEPPLVSAAAGASNRYANTMADLETPGFALKFFSYAPLMAGANWCITAEQIMREQGGDVQSWKIQSPYDWDGSWTNPNDVELAWHIYLAGLDSGFNYYGGLGNDDENKPALATKRAIDKLGSFMSTRMNLDKTPPTILKPQRFPYNPGEYTFGWYNNIASAPGYLKKMPSEFYVWTHAYDLNGIPDGGVVLKVRVDKDGVNSMATTHNETFAGGSDVGTWLSVPMTKRILKKTRAALNAAASNSQIDYFVFDPAFWSNPQIADYYFAKITDAQVPSFRGKLLDYYIEASDSKGNIHKSDIQQVWVGDDGTSSTIPPSASFAPVAPSNCAPIAVLFNAATSSLANAATVNAIYRFSPTMSEWGTVAMTRTSTNTFSVNFSPVPDDATQLEVAFTDGTSWANNDGANWNVIIRACPSIYTGLTITNPPTATSTMENSVTSIRVAGTAADFAGHFRWTNKLTHGTGVIPAAARWAIPEIPLGVGVNEIIVTASNVVASGTHILAQDSGSAATYSSTWAAGQNGGTGFSSWAFNHTQGTGYAGGFVGNPGDGGILGMGTRAFGFYANPAGSGANAEVQRDFATPMSIGATFRFDWGVNWDSATPSSYRGCSLLAGDTELIYINMGDSPVIFINGSTMFSNYGTQAMPLRFHYTSDGNIRVTATGRDGIETFDTTFAVSLGAPSRIKFYFNASQRPDGADEAKRQMYFDNLQITTPAVGSVELTSDTVTVTRQSSGSIPVPEISGMNVASTGNGFSFDLSQSEPGVTYSIWSTPTLFPSQNWQKVVGTEVLSTGGVLQLIHTNLILPLDFFRIGYEP